MALKMGEAEMRRLMRWLRRDPQIALRFQDRRYRLGDTIDIAVEISASRSLHLTEALIDLVHERKYIVNSSMMVPDYMVTRASMRGPLAGRKVMVPKRVTEQLMDSYLHSSTTFAGETRIAAGSRHTCGAKLAVQTYVPPHCGEGVTRWLLKATLRLSSGREVTHAEPVTISLV